MESRTAIHIRSWLHTFVRIQPIDFSGRGKEALDEAAAMFLQPSIDLGGDEEK